MLASRWALLLLLLGTSTSAAQVDEPQSRVTLAMADPMQATLQAGNSTITPFRVMVDFAGVFCQGPASLHLSFAISGQDAALEVEAPTTVDVPFSTGPAQSTPAGPAPGIASPSEATVNVTVTAKPAHRGANLTLQAIAGFTTLPTGCQAITTPEASQASANQTLHVVPRLQARGSASASESGGEPGGGGSRDAPGPGAPLLVAVLAAVIASRRR